jgi:hypothetical protein
MTKEQILVENYQAAIRTFEGVEYVRKDAVDAVLDHMIGEISLVQNELKNRIIF